MTEKGYRIRMDGTAEICYGGIEIKGISPFVNDAPFLPFSVSASSDEISFTSEDKAIKYSFIQAEDELVLRTTADGFDHVHDIEPFGAAVLTGADHVYAQGFGMEGLSGYHLIDGQLRRSHGIIGLAGGDSAVAIFTTDQTQYSTQFAVVNREGMYTSETLLSAGINLEGTASGRLQLPDIHFIAGTDVTDCMKRAAEKIAAEMPFITDDREELVIIHRLPDWNLLYILNPTGHLLRIHYDLADMFGMETVFQYRFDWNDDDRIVSENSSCFSDTLAPHESALLFITEDPMTAKPSNLWGRAKVIVKGFLGGKNEEKQL